MMKLFVIVALATTMQVVLSRPDDDRAVSGVSSSLSRSSEEQQWGPWISARGARSMYVIYTHI